VVAFFADELVVQQLVEDSEQLLLAQSRDLAEQGEVEADARDRRDLEYRQRLRRQASCAPVHDFLDAAWNSEARELDQVVVRAIAGFGNHGPKDLLDEERVAAGQRNEPIEEGRAGGPRLAKCRAQHGLDLRGGEGCETELVG